MSRLLKIISPVTVLTAPKKRYDPMASANINPRLRMITLYAYAHANNLLVAGRCISGTHEAHSSYRVMRICMAMGDAAGHAEDTGLLVEQIEDLVDILALFIGDVLNNGGIQVA